jgi:hypothetical protein
MIMCGLAGDALKTPTILTTKVKRSPKTKGGAADTRIIHPPMGLDGRIDDLRGGVVDHVEPPDEHDWINPSWIMTSTRASRVRRDR